MRYNHALTRLGLSAALVLGGASSGRATNLPIGTQGNLVASGGNVFLTFVSRAAVQYEELWFFGSTNPGPSQSPSVTGAAFVLANNGAKFSKYGTHPQALVYTPPALASQTVFLGSFAAGTPLDFGLFVRNLTNPGNAPNGRWYYTGLASQNPGNNIHAQLVSSGHNDVVVGFEDLCKQANVSNACSADSKKNVTAWEYNALRFNLQGATVTPEPVTMVLFGTGLFGLGALRWRRRKPETTPEA